MINKTVVALNIGSTGVKLLSMHGKEIEKWGSMPLPPGLVKDGLILKPKVVGTVINSLFKSTGIPRKNVIVGLTGLSFIHRVLTLPKMESDSLLEALRRAAGKEMLLSLENLYLCGQVIDKKAIEKSFLVFGVPRYPIDVLLQALREAGIEPFAIDLNPLALARVARRRQAIIVNLEPGCCNIVLVADGIPNIIRTVTPVEAGVTAADVNRRLADELAKIVEFYNNNHPQNPIGPRIDVLLTGELSANVTPGELNTEDAGYSFELLKTPLHLPEDLPAASFTTNIGLALREVSLGSRRNGKATSFHDITVDIQSEQFGIKNRWFKLHHILLSLAIIASLALLFPVMQLTNHADAEAVRLQADFTAVNQALGEAQSADAQARQIEDKINILTSDTESIIDNFQSIKELGGNYAYYLKIVNDALPAGAQFTSVSIGKTNIAVSGTVDNPFTVITYSLALESLGTFEEVRILSIGYSNDSAGGPISFGIAITKKA